MHITELWVKKKKKVIGNLSFQKDGLKVLKMYPKQKNYLFID